MNDRASLLRFQKLGHMLSRVGLEICVFLGALPDRLLMMLLSSLPDPLVPGREPGRLARILSMKPGRLSAWNTDLSKVVAGERPPPMLLPESE